MVSGKRRTREKLREHWRLTRPIGDFHNTEVPVLTCESFIDCVPKHFENPKNHQAWITLIRVGRQSVQEKHFPLKAIIMSRFKIAQPNDAFLKRRHQFD
jgi:hypothetical protein